MQKEGANALPVNGSSARREVGRCGGSLYISLLTILYIDGMDVAVTGLGSHLSRWIDAARKGNDIVITDRGTPVARIVALDSTALVKLVLDEVGSDIAAALWNACDVALSSRLAYPEVRAALAAAERNHDLTAPEAAAAGSDWKLFWGSMRPVELSADVERVAGSRSTPAIHGKRPAEAGL